jgi:hypothetical protein
MTFLQLQALVKDRLFEGSTTGGGLLKDIKRIINDAHTMLYNDATQKQPDIFSTTSDEKTYVADTGVDAFGTGLGAEGCHFINAVEMKTSAGEWVPLTPMNRREVGSIGGDVVGIGGSAPCTGWWLERFKIYCYPRPKDSQIIRVDYVPGVTDLVNDGDFPFAGALRNFHALVGYEAVMLASDKDATPELLYRTYKRMKGQFDNYLGALQRQAPRRIVRTDEEWFDY